VSCVPFTPDYSCSDDWDTLPPELQERATDLAWSALRALSGGRVGNCPVVVRPCLGAPCTACRQSWWTAAWVQATLVNGVWGNCICCDSTECSCEPLCEIVMPGEVAEITEVSLDGTALPLEDFRIDNGNRIVRMDGACWPSCQNLTRPLGEIGTLGITYVPGIIPDSSALWAAGVLASEFAKACTGGKCRLPATVTTIARQGVNFTLAGTMFEGGVTGIREVDAYVYSVNPHRLKMPSVVWSPDASWTKHRYESVSMSTHLIVIRNIDDAGWKGELTAYVVKNGQRGAPLPLIRQMKGGDMHVKIVLPRSGAQWVLEHDGKQVASS
jgi:hypothetical protein